MNHNFFTLAGVIVVSSLALLLVVWMFEKAGERIGFFLNRRS